MDEPLTSPAVTAKVPPAKAKNRSVWMTLDAEGRKTALARLSQLPLADRLLATSERFLQTPYHLSPLGEGGGTDPDPYFRLDAVDCLTFVEETIAMSLAPSLDRVEPLLE